MWDVRSQHLLRANKLRGGLARTGYRIQGTGYRVQDTGYRIQGTGYRIQDTGYRIIIIIIR